MALLPILRFPDARLQRIARPVQAVDARIRQLAADMLETMYEAKGIGLAATQVNVHEQVIVIDISEEKNAPQVLINPQLLWASDERIKGDEGCLSVPTYRFPTRRAERAILRAYDEHGKAYEKEAEGCTKILYCYYNRVTTP